ncbi:monooxygenase, variant 3 [Balamuthia mandrillaris]
MGKSGSDIAEELLPVCSKLLLCSARWKIYHSMLESSSSTSLSDFFPILQAEKVVATGVPSRLDGRTLIWDDAEDGDETETGCDIIIYCTGYEFDFEFLDEDGEDILVIKQAVKSVATSSYIPLYQFMMPPSHPTLAIIALHPVAEAQGLHSSILSFSYTLLSWSLFFFLLAFFELYFVFLCIDGHR